MQVFILFGPPGAGKTFVGKIFQKVFGYFQFEGDDVLPKDMRSAINTKSKVTTDMRDRFFDTLIACVKQLQKKYTRLVVTQTFIKEKYRAQLLTKIPNARFILIDTNTNYREDRLTKRTYYPLDIEYTQIMCKNFDPPQIPHEVMTNNEDGEENIIRQVRGLLQ